MNKQEFIVQLKSLLRVSSEDEASLVEEYEAYIDEAMANGESEEQVISNLESPEEIAATANEDLGIDSSKKFKDYVDNSFDSMKDGYEKVVDSDFMNNVSEQIESAMKSVGESLKGLNIGATVSKAMEKVGAELEKVKDINIEASFKDMAMKFDNSRVETFDYEKEDLNIVITDDNSQSLNVEVIGGTSNVVVKSLPTTLMHTIALDDEGTLTINVPESNIKYAERKRMRVYIPNVVTNVSVKGNVPISIKDLEASVEVETQNAPVSMRDIEGESVKVNTGDGPLNIKDIETAVISVEVKNAPVNMKDIEAQKGVLNVGNGPLNVKDIEIDVFTLDAGNGPVSIKCVDGSNHKYNLGAGPKVVKDIDAEVLTVTASGGIITMKDISVTKLSGDIAGTVKTLKNIDAEEFEMNK